VGRLWCPGGRTGESFGKGGGLWKKRVRQDFWGGGLLSRGQAGFGGTKARGRRSSWLARKLDLEGGERSIQLGHHSWERVHGGKKKRDELKREKERLARGRVPGPRKLSLGGGHWGGKKRASGKQEIGKSQDCSWLII